MVGLVVCGCIFPMVFTRVGNMHGLTDKLFKSMFNLFMLVCAIEGPEIMFKEHGGVKRYGGCDSPHVNF